MARVVTFGDNVVDCYAEQGVMFPGGNALNVACFARAAGAEAAYIGAVADDAAGRHIREQLAAAGIDISRLRSLPGRTAYCVIGSRDGEREFLRADLGVSIIRPDLGDLDFIGGFDAVHTGRSSHIDADLPDLAARTRLSFDFAVMHDAARIASIAPHCFLASFSGGTLSDDEAEALQCQAHAAGATWCLVTRGRLGATLSGPDGTVGVAALETDVVDTLGAGDSFIARTLVGLLRQESPAVLMKEAAEAAGATCGRLGAVGLSAPIAIDESTASTLDEIYGQTAGNSE